MNVWLQRGLCVNVWLQRRTCGSIPPLMGVASCVYLVGSDKVGGAAAGYLSLAGMPARHVACRVQKWSHVCFNMWLQRRRRYHAIFRKESRVFERVGADVNML